MYNNDLESKFQIDDISNILDSDLLSNPISLSLINLPLEDYIDE